MDKSKMIVLGFLSFVGAVIGMFTGAIILPLKLMDGKINFEEIINSINKNNTNVDKL